MGQDDALASKSDEVVGRIKRTKMTDTKHKAANTPKINVRGTFRFSISPKPQSAKPPHEILTMFMIPYPVARLFGRTIWQRIGMLLQSKNPQPIPKSTSAAIASNMDFSLVAYPTIKSDGMMREVPNALT